MEHRDKIIIYMKTFASLFRKITFSIYVVNILSNYRARQYVNYGIVLN